MNAPQATRARPDPTEMRRTPRSASRATDSPADGDETRTLTGRGHGLDDRRDLVGIGHAGRIQAVGAGVGERDEPIECRASGVGIADQPCLASGGQDDLAAGRVDRRSRGPDALDGQRSFEERGGVIAGRVLDREAGDPGRDAERHVRGHAFRVVRVARQEVRVHGHGRRSGDLRDVLEHGQRHHFTRSDREAAAEREA